MGVPPRLTLLGLTVAASGALGVWRGCYCPAPADLEAAAKYVRGTFEPGDLILVEPRYLAGPRQRLGDLTLWEPRHLDGNDLAPFARVHLIRLSALGRRTDFRALLSQRAELESEHQWGGVRVWTFRQSEPAPILFDLRDGLAEVTVTADYADGTRVSCDRRQGQRWICPRDPGWSYVGPEILDIDGQPRDCVWLHPLRAGARLRIELPPFPSGAAQGIRAAFGFTADAARRAQAPVTVRLLSGVQLIGQETFPVAPGWRWLKVADGGSAQPLTLEVSTSNNGAAHFCGMLQVLGAAGGEP